MDAVNTDETSRPGGSRGFVVLALTLVGAGALGVAGFRSGEGTVLYAEDAVMSVPPSTVQPVATTVPAEAPPTTPAPASAVPEPSAPAATEQTVPPSTDASAAPTTTVPEPKPEPVGLQISRFDVSRYPVRAVGLDDEGGLEIPDETEIGWYKYGATAGRPGSTVLAAHVNWNGSQGPFAQLGAVEPGDQIEVALEDGMTRNYVVTERTMYGKLELPKDRIWRNTGPEELVLITCGGDFNPEIRRFRSNIVVYAVPVA